VLRSHHIPSRSFFGTQARGVNRIFIQCTSIALILLVIPRRSAVISRARVTISPHSFLVVFGYVRPQISGRLRANPDEYPCPNRPGAHCRTSPLYEIRRILDKEAYESSSGRLKDFRTSLIDCGDPIKSDSSDLARDRHVGPGLISVSECAEFALRFSSALDWARPIRRDFKLLRAFGWVPVGLGWVLITDPDMLSLDTRQWFIAT
jgi:hypothetical protein